MDSQSTLAAFRNFYTSSSGLPVENQTCPCFFFSPPSQLLPLIGLAHCQLVHILVCNHWRMAYGLVLMWPSSCPCKGNSGEDGWCFVPPAGETVFRILNSLADFVLCSIMNNWCQWFWVLLRIFGWELVRNWSITKPFTEKIEFCWVKQSARHHKCTNQKFRGLPMIPKLCHPSNADTRCIWPIPAESDFWKATRMLVEQPPFQNNDAIVLQCQFQLPCFNGPNTELLIHVFPWSQYFGRRWKSGLFGANPSCFACSVQHEW